MKTSTKVFNVDGPCIVRITSDDSGIKVEIETVPRSSARRLHDTLIGPNRPFDSQKDLIEALLCESEFEGNKPNSMKVTMSQWFAGDKPISGRTFHAIAKAYRCRTGKVLDF